MGCALYCYNNLCYLKSRGRYEGNNIFRFILMVYAYIIPPIIIVQLAARINSLGDRILFGSNKKKNEKAAFAVFFVVCYAKIKFVKICAQLMRI